MRLLLLLFAVGSLGCIAAAVSGFARGYAGSQRSGPQVQQQPTLKACSSDFACRYGQKCVKEQFQMNGYCADVVDEYGNKTYDHAPDTNSVGPGDPSQCQFDTDCAIGFHCIKGRGIYGTCLK